MAGPAIFSGATVKLLKPILDLFGQAQVLSGSVNPSVTATSAPKGSIYLSTLTGLTYMKTDSGSSTNWVIPPTNPLTTVGDLWVGDTSGAPDRLPAGQANYVLTSAGLSTKPYWSLPTSPLALSIQVATSVTLTGLPSATSFPALSSNSIALTPGVYELQASMSMAFPATTGSGIGIYGSNGTNTITPPTLLSSVGTITVNSVFSDSSGQMVFANKAVAGASTAMVMNTPPVIITVNSNTTLYAVPYCETGSFSSGSLYVKMWARKIYN